jgi:uncharacterized membrane protein (DUF4010 family)
MDQRTSRVWTTRFVTIGTNEVGALASADYEKISLTSGGTLADMLRNRYEVVGMCSIESGVLLALRTSR